MIGENDKYHFGLNLKGLYIDDLYIYIDKCKDYSIDNCISILKIVIYLYVKLSGATYHVYFNV